MYLSESTHVKVSETEVVLSAKNAMYCKGVSPIFSLSSCYMLYLLYFFMASDGMLNTMSKNGRTMSYLEYYPSILNSSNATRYKIGIYIFYTIAITNLSS